MNKISVLSKLVRFRDAPDYLGLDNRLNKEVRHYVTEIPIEIQGITFDKPDLDAWTKHYKHHIRCLAGQP